MVAIRLTIEELNAVIAAAIAVFDVRLLRIRLYGSRADTQKSGGDIDLIFEVSGKDLDKFSLAQKLRLELTSRIGEQKFGLMIILEDLAENTDRENHFFKLIEPTSKLIWTRENR